MMTLYHGDCLVEMGRVEDGSVDLVYCDLPFNVTACHWDKLIPFEPLWAHFKRVLKESGAVVAHGVQPFTTDLINSNREWFKYCWYWRKSKANGWQHAKNKPMFVMEDLCVFSAAPMGHKSKLGNRRMTYNPQGIISVGTKKVTAVAHGRMMGARPNQVGKEYEAFTNFPNNLLEFPNVIGESAVHPTQKPEEMVEQIIRTYTNPGDLVLDPTMGSGTAGVAAANLDRNFIGIEMDEHYFQVASERIEKAERAARQMEMEL